VLSGQRLLIADIDSWQYRIELVSSEEKLTGRHLVLGGLTRQTAFLPPTELSFEVFEEVRAPVYRVIESADGTGLKLGEVVYHNRRPEDDLPPFVHATVHVFPPQFDRIAELIRLQEQGNALALSVQSSLYGLDLGGETAADQWPAGKAISITDQKVILVKRPVEKEPKA
jgi:hypothetical protein